MVFYERYSKFVVLGICKKIEVCVEEWYEAMKDYEFVSVKCV